MRTRRGLEEFYVSCERSVFRRARRLLGEEEAAKDVTQDVFLRALKIDGKPLSSPAAWSYRVVTNLCLKRLRDTRRRAELLSSWLPDESREDGPDARLLLHRILEQVPTDLRNIATYCYVDELSHQEIALILGVSRRTIGNRLAAFHLLVGDYLAKGARAARPLPDWRLVQPSGAAGR
jgi:RNA polymerase sigma factor (sigma-70 family)